MTDGKEEGVRDESGDSRREEKKRWCYMSVPYVAAAVIVDRENDGKIKQIKSIRRVSRANSLAHSIVNIACNWRSFIRPWFIGVREKKMGGY